MFPSTWKTVSGNLGVFATSYDFEERSLLSFILESTNVGKGVGVDIPELKNTCRCDNESGIIRSHKSGERKKAQLPAKRSNNWNVDTIKAGQRKAWLYIGRLSG
ncbi:Protein of unknown function [Gryllus bimaculatus]|nr:Protein of unknown function [Gryllus bimaculatus]